MNFRQLAFNNIKGNWRSYKAFIISSTLSIIVFFMYASFIYHPDVVNGHIEQRANIEEGLKVLNYVIVIFSALFILYSNSMFLRSRKKELGLLTLIGATKGQLGKMLIREQMILGSISIVVGIAIGMLFSTLFFKAVSFVLGIETTLPFVWNGTAIGITAGVYIVLFFVLSLFSLRTVWKFQIIDLLRDARKQRIEPFASIWLFVVGLACIVVAYALCFQVTLANFPVFFLLIVGLTILGSYFLFTQGSVIVLKALQRKQSFFYQQPNMFVFSNLIYKMKDNGRFLFVVSIITAVVASAGGTLYVFFEDMSSKTLQMHPHAISYVGQNVEMDKVEKEMQSLVEKHGFEDARQVTGEMLQGKVAMDNAPQLNIDMISESTFNNEAKVKNQEELHVEPGTAIAVMEGTQQDYMEQVANIDLEKPLKFMVQNQTYNVSLHEPKSTVIFNTKGFFVVSDEDYATYASAVPDNEKKVYIGYEIGNWKDTEALATEIREQVISERGGDYQEIASAYKQTKEMGSITMFIGFFVMVLFFFFACSMTYFKWFNDKEQDRIQFKSLKRIGMTDKEIRKIALRQMGAIFFIPILVGIVHSSFALYTLGSMLFLDLWKSGALIITAYLLASALYFAIAQRGYLKHVKS
jgi:putative ABC transport system permease protein